MESHRYRRTGEIRRFPFPHRDGLDPLPEFAELRQYEPVVRVRLPSGDTAWLVTRHSDVRRVLTDPRFSRARATRGTGPRISRTTTLPHSVLAADPPDHTRLRKLIAPALTARRAESMRRSIASLVDGLLTGLAALPQPTDLVTHFTRRLPLAIICDLLGTPHEDGERLDHWCEALRSVTAMTDDRVDSAVEEMTGYLAGLVSAKRAHPRDDMLSALIAARDDDDRLSEDELVSFCVVLLAGGYGTTANRLASMVYLLLERPERYERLCREPALVPGAIEELLRYAQNTVGGNLRVATEEMALGGVIIREGEAVMAVTGSANHDERAFPHPDLLDLTRDVRSHLSFGHGAHFCVGAQVARVQLHEALAGLTARFPTLYAAAPATWKSGLISRAPRSLPVGW
ncbi:MULTISPECIES: cytochrome P450 [unclassified Streptomyces]|uniref:cytochrome P450 n=1 Tax=unclassified Streptomyces TaxID=2593676 RepID=UPI003805F4D7